MIQLFKEYYNEMIVPYWADVKDAFNNAKEYFGELVNYFK